MTIYDNIVKLEKDMRTYITNDPKIMGGTAVVGKTRVPVKRITFLLKEGYNLEAIHEEYPQISISTLKGLLDELTKKIDTSSHEAQAFTAA